MLHFAEAMTQERGGFAVKHLTRPFLCHCEERSDVAISAIRQNTNKAQMLRLATTMED
jgi:hypothetical protein